MSLIWNLFGTFCNLCDDSVFTMQQIVWLTLQVLQHPLRNLDTDTLAVFSIEWVKPCCSNRKKWIVTVTENILMVDRLVTFINMYEEHEKWWAIAGHTLARGSLKTYVDTHSFGWQLVSVIHNLYVFVTQWTNSLFLALSVIRMYFG